MDENCVEIKNESIDLQDYLSPYLNLSLEKQYKIFSLGTRMNPLKSNFSRKEKNKEDFRRQKVFESKR